MAVALATDEFMSTNNELMEKAIELATRNNLKLKFLQGIIFVESIFDAWYLEDYSSYVELYHKNTSNKSYHLQRRFTNIYQTIDSIVKHDVYKLN